MLYARSARRLTFEPSPTPKVAQHTLFNADWTCVERSTIPASDASGDLESFAAHFVKCPAGQVLSAAEKGVEEKLSKLINNNGKKSVDFFHKRLGRIMWEKCGMSRNKENLETAIRDIQKLRKEFHENLFVPGEKNEYNEELAKACRVADFMELGELFAKDALHREESCGGHFREEYQTKDGEALRNDAEYAFASAWEYQETGEPILHKEELKFEFVELKSRSYK